MRRNLSIHFALIAWFAVLTRFLLMLENRVASVPETLVRFFSFFTILTNLLVAIYFTSQSFQRKNHSAGFINKPGVLTSVTVYITIVGLVYQILLRHIWQPTGLQKIVDELLHSLIPLLVIIYWYFFENKSKVKYRQVFKMVDLSFGLPFLHFNKRKLFRFLPLPFC